MAANQNTKVHTGDNAELTIEALDCDGDPALMTDKAIAYYVRSRPGQLPVITKISGATGGIVIDQNTIFVQLESDDTDLDGTYFHELVATDIFGKIHVGFTGYITFGKRAITCCDPLTARFDDDIFSANSYPFDFSDPANSLNAIFLFNDILFTDPIVGITWDFSQGSAYAVILVEEAL